MYRLRINVLFDVNCDNKIASFDNADHLSSAFGFLEMILQEFHPHTT